MVGDVVVVGAVVVVESGEVVLVATVDEEDDEATGVVLDASDVEPQAEVATSAATIIVTPTNRRVRTTHQPLEGLSARLPEDLKPGTDRTGSRWNRQTVRLVISPVPPLRTRDARTSLPVLEVILGFGDDDSTGDSKPGLRATPGAPCSQADSRLTDLKPHWVVAADEPNTIEPSKPNVPAPPDIGQRVS